MPALVHLGKPGYDGLTSVGSSRYWCRAHRAIIGTDNEWGQHALPPRPRGRRALPGTRRLRWPDRRRAPGLAPSRVARPGPPRRRGRWHVILGHPARSGRPVGKRHRHLVDRRRRRGHRRHARLRHRGRGRNHRGHGNGGRDQRNRRARGVRAGAHRPLRAGCELLQDATNTSSTSPASFPSFCRPRTAGCSRRARSPTAATASP